MKNYKAGHLILKKGMTGSKLSEEIVENLEAGLESFRASIAALKK